MGRLVGTDPGDRGALVSYSVACWRLSVAALVVVWGTVCWWVRHYRFTAAVALVHALLLLVSSWLRFDDGTGLPVGVQVKISAAVCLLVPAVVAVVSTALED